MATAPPETKRDERTAWSNARLVTACRKGDAGAWSALIDRYKNLIYSVPIKLGLHSAAADIFQSVCLDLLHDINRLREPEALPKWLIRTCYHKCLAARKYAERHRGLENENGEDAPALEPVAPTTPPDDMLADLQREQAVRNAIGALPQRCEQLVRMLFYEDPPRPYDQLARELGIATGSVGFIRGRCLDKLRKQLEKVGFQ